MKVRFYKIAGVVLCGIITSFGGIWLASYQNTYSQGMTAGRGYIALAAMIIGKWKPVNIFFVCLMFAFFRSTGNQVADYRFVYTITVYTVVTIYSNNIGIDWFYR